MNLDNTGSLSLSCISNQSHFNALSDLFLFSLCLSPSTSISVKTMVLVMSSKKKYDLRLKRL